MGYPSRYNFVAVLRNHSMSLLLFLGVGCSGLRRVFWFDVAPISVQFRRCAPKSLDVLAVF